MSEVVQGSKILSAAAVVAAAAAAEGSTLERIFGAAVDNIAASARHTS